LVYISWKFKYSKRGLAGAGTQTAALGFGGQPGAGETAATEEYDGTSWTKVEFKYSKILFSRCRYSNSSFRFWWWSTGTAATELYDGTSWTNPKV
jgi:hypothetical protein